MNARILALLVLAPSAAWAQGYAGLGTEAEGFAEVTAPVELQFPADHGPHPDYRIEWWYLTANLTDAEGIEYGVQWTLFRQALRPGPDRDGWASRQIWMAHAGLTTPDEHYVAATYARGGIGQAGVELDPFRAWIDDWEMTAEPGRGDALARLTLTANGEDFAFRLHVATEAAPIPQGENGYSVKSELGQASYYYSQPFYAAEGMLEIEGRKVAVTGQAWLDREWSSQPLAGNQEGWDWFAMHLGTGEKVMVFRLRDENGTAYRAGTWIAANGTPAPLAPDEISAEPRAEAKVEGRAIPVEWRVEIPKHGLAVDISAMNAQSFMGTLFPYWEGPIRIEGSHRGRGYLEMTGYE